MKNGFDSSKINSPKSVIWYNTGKFLKSFLVIEILSQNSAKRDKVMKKESYARFAVPEYWIVDPAHLTIEQYLLVHSGEPYELANVFGAEDTVRSERIPCVSFLVKEGLKIVMRK
ncbi:Uma2 family endonuclease [Effusibacillus lacus]|nr:Uma2 family endonuclease [Effusibacillus lacus]TCS72305.1 putative restriction endonuclease [Effusibacillus lacus]